MIHKLSRRISLVFILYGESSNEDADIYTYAFEAILSVLFNIILGIVIAFIFGSTLEGIIFMSTFALLRRFTGGYHANTHFKCILTFGIILTCSMLIISFISTFHIGIFIAFFLAAIAWLGIVALAPLEDKNKIYKDEARAKLKRKCIMVSTFLLVLCVVAGLAVNTSVALVLSLAMFSVFGSMICAIVDRRIAVK